MAEIFQREFIYIWYFFSVQFEQIFKYWALGMVIGSLVSVFGKEKIHALFTALRRKKLGIFGIVPAALLGIASPLCMYGTIPIAASFAENGMDEDWLAAFMMSSILLNPQILFYTAALGTPLVIIRFVSCLLCGIAAGIIIKLFFVGRGKNFFNFSGFREKPHQISGECLDKPAMRFLKSFGRNVKATGLFFLIGILLSALFQRYVPQEAFARLFGSSNRGFGLLMAATVGVPLYVCGGGTIPLLQSWLHSGMSAGGAAAFMITGPAAKITNLGALKIVLGIKHFLLYLIFAAAFALLTGALVNLLIGW
ncbi:MAG: permease [Treponema sp.]|jgi:uncharacterized membrane protein YraQ (UPF0718 family)|nr:permease [Treponema sp.]